MQKTLGITNCGKVRLSARQVKCLDSLTFWTLFHNPAITHKSTLKKLACLDSRRMGRFSTMRNARDRRNQRRRFAACAATILYWDEKAVEEAAWDEAAADWHSQNVGHG